MIISSLLASDSVGMIDIRSNLEDNLIWVLGVHVWHSEGAESEKYWFGLNRGCVLEINNIQFAVLKCSQTPPQKTLVMHAHWSVGC